ncbi:MAG: general secretion pathway protein GspB [Deltaproteobacteria bacterium]|nr:general secretion pathway protein GspB [Deltaproteobacteria bacterium]MBW2151925.1 general secretion pathway protein GspB [Deltaproteobacteria bacterium]
MSSILKALRKLEPVTHYSSNATHWMQRRHRNMVNIGSWFTRSFKYISLLIPGAVLISAGAYINFRYPHIIANLIQPRLPGKSQDALPLKGFRLKESSQKVPKLVLLDNKKKQSILSYDSSKRLSVQENPPLNRFIEKRAVEKLKHPLHPSKHPSGVSDNILDPKVQSKSKRIRLKRKSPISIPLSEDSGLTLQAIAWSKNPKQRITVINGQILREGERVEGFTIAGIEKDAVIIRQGETTKMLTFRPR